MPRWLLDARRTLLLAVVPLSLAGCAGMYEATGTASQQDLAQLHSDVEALKVSVQRMHTEIETAVTQIDQRIRATGIPLLDRLGVQILEIHRLVET